MSNRKGNPWACLSQPGGCGCRCHAIRAGQLRGRVRADLWTPEQDAIVRRGVERGDAFATIAATIEHDHKISRSQWAIGARVKALGLAGRQGWRTQHELCLLFRVTDRTIHRWRAQGQLQSTMHAHWYRFTDADVEAFIREWAGRLFDPAQVQDARLRALAEVSARANARATA